MMTDKRIVKRDGVEYVIHEHVGDSTLIEEAIKQLNDGKGAGVSNAYSYDGFKVKGVASVYFRMTSSEKEEMFLEAKNLLGQTSRVPCKEKLVKASRLLSDIAGAV